MFPFRRRPVLNPTPNTIREHEKLDDRMRRVAPWLPIVSQLLDGCSRTHLRLWAGKIRESYPNIVPLDRLCRRQRDALVCWFAACYASRIDILAHRPPAPQPVIESDERTAAIAPQETELSNTGIHQSPATDDSGIPKSDANDPSATTESATADDSDVEIDSSLDEW
jgi:hypothetical protein